MLSHIARCIALAAYWHRHALRSALLIVALLAILVVRTWTDRVPAEDAATSARIACVDGTASRTCSTIHAGCCSSHGGVRR